MTATERVVSNPEVCSGKPVIRGTRVMVRNILSMVRAGCSFDEVMRSYPGVSIADIQAAVDYAIELVDDVQLVTH